MAVTALPFWFSVGMGCGVSESCWKEGWVNLSYKKN